MQNFVSLDTDKNTSDDQIEFDKDIDDILKEIENDPDLKIDEEEIEKILKEIDSWSDHQKPSIKLDTSALNEAKNMFKKQ